MPKQPPHKPTTPDGADRVVAIGDLNGAGAVLREMLCGLGVIDRREHWRGRRTHLIQVGDLFNRGPDARDAFLLLRRLAARAPRHGGKVTVLLGNHEVMTALRNEAYCTVEEYLAFATPAQRRVWPERVSRALHRIYRDHPPGGPIPPLGPRLDAWKFANVPGRSALRRELSERGAIGRELRELPVAVIAAGCVFCHGGLTPAWARLGIDGLHQAARRAWQSAPRFYGDLPKGGIFRARNGPLWNREVTMRETAKTRRQLARTLERLSARRMVVGHTPTSILPGGRTGHIALRHSGKLVCIDVGIGRREPSPRTALIIENGVGVEWTPEGTRVLWRERSTDRPRHRRNRTKNARRSSG